MVDKERWRVEGTLRHGDFARFGLFHLHRRLWLMDLFVLFAGLLVLSAFLATIKSDTYEQYSGVFKNCVPIAVLYLVVNLLPIYQAKGISSRHPYLAKPVYITVDESNVQIEGASFSSKMQWNLVHEIHETGRAFLIYNSPSQAWIMPKRFLPSEGAVVDWRSFVTRHLTKPGSFKHKTWFSSFF